MTVAVQREPTDDAESSSSPISSVASGPAQGAIPLLTVSSRASGSKIDPARATRTINSGAIETRL